MNVLLILFFKKFMIMVFFLKKYLTIKTFSVFWKKHDLILLLE